MRGICHWSPWPVVRNYCVRCSRRQWRRHPPALRRDEAMLRVSGIRIQLIVEILRWFGPSFRSSPSIRAENLFLRRQLALYVERDGKPRRIDSATRITLSLPSRFRNWRDALVVRPETMIRWHRAGWRLKSRPGRPPVPKELQALIRRMGSENPSWGEERIANELLLKLGIQITPRTGPSTYSWSSSTAVVA